MTLPATMRALVLDTHGTLEQQLRVTAGKPVPVADAGHVVVRVRASPMPTCPACAWCAWARPR